MDQGSTSLRLSSKPGALPKDISQALGKLPPQATDIEEAVLGSLMLETKSLDKVKFLKPVHFYHDGHAEIFRAITQVVAEGIMPDMRQVRVKLSANGKLEMVGGAYKLADLTSKVSSAANIEHDARVIVEMSMKREMIRLANGIHQEAYEDTTDVFDLFKKFKADLEFLEQRETSASGPEKIKLLWEKLQITTKPDRPEALIRIGESDVCTVGNISLLIGKKKSRKSLLVTHLLHIYLSSRDHLAEDVVIFDTEQEEYDVWAMRDRIYRMTNCFVSIYSLRGLNPKERRDFIEQTIEYWEWNDSLGRPISKKPRIAVIDGIRDCMSNINDPDETTEVMSWLMRMNVEYKTHFINILHLNKTDNNARGHIGTELLNKAEITMEVELDPHSKEVNPPSIVRCESSRRKPFENFIFTHGATGLPELLGAPIGRDHEDMDEQSKKLQLVFEDQVLKFSEVKDGIKAHFAVGDNKAKQILAKFIQRGWILKSGPDRSPNTSYKINVKPSEYVPPPVVIPQPEQQPIAFTDSSDITEELPF